MPRNSHKYLAGNFVEEIKIDFLFRKVTLQIERTWEIERIPTFHFFRFLWDVFVLKLVVVW